MSTWMSRSVGATRRLGEALGRAAEPGDCLLLRGPLGAGKTELVRGLARGLGCTARVRSPTFNLVHRLEGGRLVLHHLDLYRIEDPRELRELGLEEALGGEGVAAVEWSERLGGHAPAAALTCDLALEGESRRSIRLEARGEHCARWLHAARREGWDEDPGY